MAPSPSRAQRSIFLKRSFGDQTVKRSIFVFVAGCTAMVIGCSRSNEPLKFEPKAGAPVRGQTRSQQAQSTPEFIASHMESPHETANYLKGLSKDPSFKPKEHEEMLKQYSNDSNTEIASAAKELAEKAQ
jgi:hypothetical protein